MAINKVVYGDDTLIDLTQDSVEASNLLEGETAHDRSGAPVTGTAKQGHILKNQAGTAMTQRANMFFKDAGLSDNSAGAATEVEIIHQVTKAQLDALGENTDGIYETTDEEDEPWADVSDDYVEVVADGVKTRQTLLNELFAKVDLSKITIYSKFCIEEDTYHLSEKGSNYLRFFSNKIVDTLQSYTDHVLMRGSNSDVWRCTSTDAGNTVVSRASTQMSNGIIFRLYYGTKSSIVELNTDAQHCIMSDGETSVEEAIDELSNDELLETVTLNSAVSSGTVKIYKAGKHKKIVVNRVVMESNLAASSGVAIATNVTNVPSMTIVVPLQSATILPAFLILDTNGDMSIVNSASTASKIYGFGQYIYD